jgi:hypothetical protein
MKPVSPVARRALLAVAALATLLTSGVARAEVTDRHEIPTFVQARVEIVLDAGTEGASE